MKKLSLLLSLLFTGCVGVPENVKPVDNFDIHRYLGKWYEIARLEHSFERGLTRVSAEYALREDGGLKMINRGYSAQKDKWKEAVGKAYFVEELSKGYLKVSFFGPFYGSYVVMDLDQDNYQYSLVCGPDKSYLWILSRTPAMQTEVRNRLIAKAAALGFDTSRLIYVTDD
ncbi:lipocalin family protein [Citrifermentans bemidjiense]|nr:lipocalin family protein [Citrifermentans bemidjiense]